MSAKKIKQELKPGTKFYVLLWDFPGAIPIKEFDTLSAAKKFCRDQGYIESRLDGKLPKCYVSAEYKKVIGWNGLIPIHSEIETERLMIYQPKFR